MHLGRTTDRKQAGEENPQPMSTELHEPLINIVGRAGDAILEVYATDFDVADKADNSPLTQADLAAHRVIAEGLAELDPTTPMISEESDPPPFAERRHWRRYWLVDPLDGTREFVSRNGEFTVNIALMEDGVPTLGMVGVPVQQRIFVGDCNPEHRAAYVLEAGRRNQLRTRRFPSSGSATPGITVVASRSHGGARLEAWLETLAEAFGDLRRTPVGSSLKFCLLAEGKADFYPRLGPTSEWDIAAAAAVLVAAGGIVRQFDGNPIPYNAEESFLNPEFYAAADGTYAWQQHLPPLAKI